MEALVIDASIAVKWVVEEEGTGAALGLRSGFRFLAPELMIAECANILWKKVKRGELVPGEARMASQLLERAGIEFVSMQGTLVQATELAVSLSHPAYDCIYLGVALKRERRFVTADQRLLRAVSEGGSNDLKRLCVSLSDLNDAPH